MMYCGFDVGSYQWRGESGGTFSPADGEDANVPRNPVRVRFDPRVPLLDHPATSELDGREEVILAAIDPGGG